MVEEILITFLVCVVLPLGIVWLVTRAKMQKNKLTSEIILSAIEKNSNIDIGEFAKSLSHTTNKVALTPQERLLKNLKIGLATLIIGFGLAIYSFIFIDISNSKAYIIASIILIGIGIGSLVTYYVGKKNTPNEKSNE